ncbi:MAG TPA: N-acetyltransferase [Deltaproteobacteria bacterium]|nr:N-acetyltransferase [Deltaproteobacteria bacterium]
MIADVTIRPMNIDDLPGVFHLGEELFTLHQYPTLYRTWDEYEVLSFYSTDPEFCLVATRQDNIVGFCLGTIIDKRNSPRKYGYLVWFGIDDSFQRTGLGTRIFGQFKNILEEHGVTMMLVDTSADNEKALTFFKNQGFSSPRDHVYLSLRMGKN